MPPVDPNVVYNGLVTRPYFTVSTLPAASAGNVGQEQFVTDANAHPANNMGQTAAGGGTYRARVRSDGTVWRLAGTFMY